MAETVQGRKRGYDNVAVGSVWGRDNIAVGSDPVAEPNGSGSNIAVGSAHPAGNISDNQQVGVVTMVGERLG